MWRLRGWGSRTQHREFLFKGWWVSIEEIKFKDIFLTDSEANEFLKPSDMIRQRDISLRGICIYIIWLLKLSLKLTWILSSLKNCNVFTKDQKIFKGWQYLCKQLKSKKPLRVVSPKWEELEVCQLRLGRTHWSLSRCSILWCNWA